MRVFYDQLNRPVNIPSIPQRIISVVPSQTELLFYLGLDQEVIGITKFCIHPAQQFKSKMRIGGTKQLDIEKIKSLKPDLIIANKEENEYQQIEELSRHFPVWISDIDDLTGALNMIQQVGVIVGRQQQAEILVNTIVHQFDSIKIPLRTLLKAIYMIWREPYMAAGQNTFINDMLRYCGLQNAITANRYPVTDIAELVVLKPDVVLLSSEPYPFKDIHIDELRAVLPGTKILLADGEMFSWYGSRLLLAPAYFKELALQLI